MQIITRKILCPVFLKAKHLCVLLFLVFGIDALSAQEDLTVTSEYVVEAGTVLEVNNLRLHQNAEMIIRGTLIVHGNVTGDNNAPEFSMEATARVIVYGNFTAPNKMTVSVSSYLVVHGSFTKGGSDNHGELNVNNGHIYIFGYVDWFKDFQTCGDYEGGTYAIGPEPCDYGTGVDFVNNQEEFPEDLKELLDCYSLSNIEDTEVCAAGDAVFQVDQATGVEYRWQEKAAGAEEWSDIPGEKTSTLRLQNVSDNQHGSSYRVIATPTAENASCRIAVSPVARLYIKQGKLTWTGEFGTRWNNPANWSCGSLPTLESDVLIPDGLENYPVIYEGETEGQVQNINIQKGARVEVQHNWLQVSTALKIHGVLKANEGGLAFVGSSMQEIPASHLHENRLANLLVNNSAGAAINGDLEITHSVKVQQGFLQTGGGLTLLSNEERTALIDGSGAGNVLGEVKMQRYLDQAFGYKYISSPMSNSKVGDLAAYIDLKATFPNIYSYNESNKDSGGNDMTGWEAYVNPFSPLQALTGYAVNFGEKKEPVTIVLKGVVNNGHQSINLSNNNGQFTKGFNLVGNPYPSPIDWDSNGWTKTNVDDAIYFFRASEDAQYEGTYHSYVKGISSKGFSKTNGGVIPAMQGFFIHVADAHSYPVQATLGMTNEVRVADFEQEFYKSSRKAKSAKVSLLRLSARFENENGADHMVVYFDRAASSSFEKERDALKMMNTDEGVPNLYSIAPGQQELSINGSEFPVNGEKRVKLGLEVKKSGFVRVQLQDRENFPGELKVYFADLTKQTLTNLSNKQSLRVFLEEGKHDTRFELVFSVGELKDAGPSLSEKEHLKVYSNKGRIFVQLDLEEGQQGLLHLYDLGGRFVWSNEAAGKERVAVNKNLSSGVYIVRLKVGSESYVKKTLLTDF